MYTAGLNGIPQAFCQCYFKETDRETDKDREAYTDKDKESTSEKVRQDSRIWSYLQTHQRLDHSFSLVHPSFSLLKVTGISPRAVIWVSCSLKYEKVINFSFYNSLSKVSPSQTKKQKQSKAIEKMVVYTNKLTMKQINSSNNTIRL